MIARKGRNRETPGVRCSECPLSKLPHYRKFDDSEKDFVRQFKSGELRAETGTTILMEGTYSAHFYTALSGWAFRYKTLEDGRRQILNFAMPGDLLGLQAGLMNEMEHSVEALSPLTLCVFERDRFRELYTKQPSLAYDVTWMASREEQILDEHLLSVGRRSALERASYLMAFLYVRAKAVGLVQGRAPAIPITQQHVADTLGLSLVHTNKTLRKLADRKLIRWHDGGCEVLDAGKLADIAGWDAALRDNRPYI